MYVGSHKTLVYQLTSGRSGTHYAVQDEQAAGLWSFIAVAFEDGEAHY
jgi:hypothetical protein